MEEKEIKIDTLNEFEEELHILAEELIKINFFIVLFYDTSLIGTYRTKEQVTNALVKDNQDKNQWPLGVYEVTKKELQETLEEYGKIYCPELRAEYINIFELLRDLKVFSLASLIE